MISALNLQDVTAEKVRAKVAHMKTTYIQAINWRGHTGQEILEEEGEMSLKGHLLKMCPNFEKLDEKFGCKASILPPFAHDTGASQHLSSIETLDIDGVDVMVDTEVELPLTSADTVTETSDVEAMKTKLKTGSSKSGLKPAPPPKKDALTLLSDSQAQRNQMLDSKIQNEEKRLEHESSWKEKELKLKEKEIDANMELQLRKLEKEERVEKFKIEQEFKHQLELAKLKQNL